MADGWSVYLLIDPRDGVVRYVGVTGDVSSRVSTHYSQREKTPLPKDKWLQELAEQGLRPVAKIVFTSLSEAIAWGVERTTQRKYRDTILNQKICNRTADPEICEGVLYGVIEELCTTLKKLGHSGYISDKERLESAHDRLADILQMAVDDTGLPARTVKKRIWKCEDVYPNAYKFYELRDEAVRDYVFKEIHKKFKKKAKVTT